MDDTIIILKSKKRRGYIIPAFFYVLTTLCTNYSDFDYLID